MGFNIKGHKCIIGTKMWGFWGGGGGGTWIIQCDVYETVDIWQRNMWNLDVTLCMTTTIWISSFSFFFFSARFCFLPPLNFFTHLFLFLFWFGNLLGFDIFFLFFFYGSNEFLVQIFLPQLYLKKIFKICQENPIIIRYYSNFVSFKFFFTKWIIILKLVSFSINKLINEYRLLVTIILINY